MDGTLVDTAPDLLAALNAVLAWRSLPPLGMGEVQSVAGDGVEQLVRHGFAKQNSQLSEGKMEVLIERFLDYYQDHPADSSRPYPGAERLLTALRKSRIKTAVCTNKREDLAVKILEQLNIDLDAVVGVVDDGIKKPNPLHLQRVLDALGVKTHETVMVGDNLNDIDVAKGLKVPIILAAYGYGAEQLIADSAELKVEASIQSLDELLGVLNGLGAG